MATIINTPPAEDNSAAGILIGIVLVLLIILFFIFGLPYIRNTQQPQEPTPAPINTDINIQLPPRNDSTDTTPI
jgi:hypothetical protein